MFERILVPLDGSRLSSRAIPYAVEVAKRSNAELILMRVVQPAHVSVSTESVEIIPSPTATELAMQAAHLKDRENVKQARQYLQRRNSALRKRGISSSYHVELGDAAKSIVKFCHQKKIGLVVMATSGKSGLKRAFLGSVADEVVREPGVPVLVIRPVKRGRRK
jgi:nucleotide-binding universal stress UspA family protein